MHSKKSIPIRAKINKGGGESDEKSGPGNELFFDYGTERLV